MPDTAQTKTKSLSVWLVLIGAVAGIFTGLFLGDYAGVLRPLGDIYAMLLEVAVYPYLICSLLHGLGRLTPAASFRLFKAGWVFYAGLWVLTFAFLILLGLGLPKAQPLGLTPPDPEAVHTSLLQMLIPSDPFTALSQNYVPAVILFCLAFGIALQHVKEKEALLSMLDSMRQASLTFWNAVVKFAPLAVFALFAAEAGTLRVEQMESLVVFFGLFFVGALALAFWILPMLLSALTPMKSIEVLREIRSALMIAAVTTLSVAALPFITAATQRLVARCGVEDKESDEIIRTNISVAYPLGQLGNFLVYLFVLFAASFYSVVIRSFDAWLLPPISFLSCIGSPTSSVNAVQFLSAWLNLPADTTAFYVALMAFTRYGQVLASVSGFAFLSFTVVLAYYGKLQVHLGRLLMIVLATLALGGAGAWGGAALSKHQAEGKRNPYLDFSLDPELVRNVKVTFATAGEATSATDTMVRIQSTGELRVGYNDGIIPFCYRNSKGELVGYDVALAYELAADLNVNLRFVPFEWQALTQDLRAGRFDIAMSGIYVTGERLLQLKASNPYFQSPLAFFLPRERAGEFRSREQITSRSGVRIGVFNDPVLIPRVKRTFPNAQIIVLPGYETVPDFSKIDAAIWTLVQAEALAAAHPGLVAVEPSESGDPYLLAYYMPPSSTEFSSYVNYWLELKKADGFERKQRGYWISRLPRKDPAPRWSILRNVLGFQ